MKAVLPLLIGFAVSALVMPQARADHTKHPEIARAIRAQAVVIQNDAAIYQRKRVGREVRLIQNDVQKLDRLIAPHICLQAERRRLQAATRQLIRASMTANAQGTTLAAQRISDISAQVITMTCHQTVD